MTLLTHFGFRIHEPGAIGLVVFAVIFAVLVFVGLLPDEKSENKK